MILSYSSVMSKESDKKGNVRGALSIPSPVPGAVFANTCTSSTPNKPSPPFPTFALTQSRDSEMRESNFEGCGKGMGLRETER